MNKRNIQQLEWQGRFKHQKAVLFTEDDLQVKGSKFQAIKIKPGGEIDPHYHKIRTEVFYVLKGRGIITLGAENIHCEGDDFVL